MDKLNIGIVGCGQIARTRHVKELAQNDRARLVAFCDIVPERAEAMQKPHGGKVYTDYRELLKDDDVQAVFVLCCNNLHAEVALAALNAGKHVMCEKPMSYTIELCQQMVDTANANHLTLMVGHNQRLLPTHVKAREIIKSKRYGEVISFATTFGHKGCEYFSYGGLDTWFFKKEPSKFGTCADLGVHKADLMRFLLGEEISEVMAFAGTLHKKDKQGKPIEVEDNAVCLLKTESGKLGTLTASWTYAAEDNSTSIYMEHATMKLLSQPGEDIIITDQSGQVERFDLGGVQTNDNQIKSGVPDEFVDSVISRRTPLVTGFDGLQGVKIIIGCLDSAATGRAVCIN